MSGATVTEPKPRLTSELGVKYQGNIGEIPARLNLTGYDMWISDAQRGTFAVIANTPAAITVNVPRAEVTGLEFDGQLRPAPWLTLGGSVNYTDARYTQNQVSIEAAPPVAFGTYPDAPRWSGTAFAEADFPVFQGDLTASFRTDMYAQTGTWFTGIGNIDPGARYPGYALVNFRVGLEDESAGWSISATIKNAFDRVYYVGGESLGPLFQLDTVTPGNPRTFSFELRYKFGGPAAEEAEAAPYVPPPAQAPAPSAPTSYLVFFDFNKSELAGEAIQIVDQAASNSGPAHVTRLTVTGHTDTVGSDAYNMRLSRRRAESVAARLEKDGVPSSEIEIVAKGKRDLLVPTADGVREPQNRRVQILYNDGQGGA